LVKSKPQNNNILEKDQEKKDPEKTLKKNAKITPNAPYNRKAQTKLIQDYKKLPAGIIVANFKSIPAKLVN
tara:strand:+ start:187 stop:399 length:213 start_codon:yes stop_codon:yes gene_type:complete